MADLRAPSFLTHVVEAVGLPCLGADEGDVRPLAVAVGVALDQVVGRLAVPDPVAQELADAASVDHTVAGEEKEEKKKNSLLKFRESSTD